MNGCVLVGHSLSGQQGTRPQVSAQTTDPDRDPLEDTSQAQARIVRWPHAYQFDKSTGLGLATKTAPKV